VVEDSVLLEYDAISLGSWFLLPSDAASDPRRMESRILGFLKMQGVF